MSELIDISQAAEMCGQSVSTLRWWRANGEGPSSAKIGRRVMYKRAQVEAWIDSKFV